VGSQISASGVEMLHEFRFSRTAILPVGERRGAKANWIGPIEQGESAGRHGMSGGVRSALSKPCAPFIDPGRSSEPRSLADRYRCATIGQQDASAMRIGVISDTHGLLRPEAEQRLAGVAQIIHAGDIGRPDVITRLSRIAPVIAIRGNVDTGPWAKNYPDTQTAKLGGRAIHVLHDIHDLGLDPVSCGIDAVISGHSHRPRIETIKGVLYLNPGSAGPRRFNLPITLAILELTKSGVRPVIHDLATTP
jgi:uncharacterized protein